MQNPTLYREINHDDNDLGPWTTGDLVNNNNNKYIRYIQVSGSIFSGYNHTIDIRYIDNLEDIITSTKKQLRNIFEKYRMEELLSIIDNTDYHIHTHTFEDILLNNSTIYICNCGS